ncbi:hypothetical protein [Hydrogenimonas sp.]
MAVDPEVVLAERELARRLLVDYMKYIFKYAQSYRSLEFKENWHHHLIAEALELLRIGKELRRLMLHIPPGYGKTEEAVRMWVSHTLGRNPWHKFIHTTYAADLAVKNSSDVKLIMRDPAYHTLFPNVEIDRTQDEKHFWRTKDGGGMYSVGNGGAVTGFHGHTIIMDDPVKAQEAHSSRANREAYEGHYRGAMLSRLQDKKHGGILIIMQRLSDIDLAARILKDNPDEYEVISIPALEKRPKVYEIGSFRYERQANEPLFDAWEDYDSLMATKRSMGTTAWSAQYMQDPERVEEGFYTDEDFVTVTDFEIPDQNIGIIVDPADSSADAADNRAIGVYGTSVDEDKMERIVVHDGWFGTWNPTETIEWVIYAMVKYPDAPVFIFNLGGGYTLEHNLKKEVLRRNAKLKAEGKPAIRNRVTIIKHKNVRNEKNAKIEGMQPYFQMHQIQFRREANPEFIGQMKKELKSFNPEKDSPKDDCMETLAEFVIGGHVPPKGVAREKPKETSRRKKRGGGWRV